MARHKELQGFIEDTRRFLEAQRRAVTQALGDIEGLRIFASPTSYLLIRLPEPWTSTEVCKKLLAHRILIRDCANFKGLSDRYVRISLKESPSNQRFADRFREVLGAPA